MTSFTVAPSLTLLLAALDIVRLPARLGESDIAATLVSVAVQNLRDAPTERRWQLTSGFGLIHGFGFANVLGEMNRPTTGLARCLLAFNVGVELGQRAFLAAAFPLVAWLRTGRHERHAVVAISALLALFGAAWFTGRAVNLGMVPFCAAAFVPLARKPATTSLRARSSSRGCFLELRGPRGRTSDHH